VIAQAIKYAKIGDMRIPHKRKKTLWIFGGTLFVINILALAFSIQYVIDTPSVASQAQWASGAASGR
jgi:hypothetical protein